MSNCHSAPAPRLLALGDSAWTLEFGEAIDPVLNGRVMALAALVDDERRRSPALAGITDLVPTFRSLTVHYDARDADPAALGDALLQLAGSAGASVASGRLWHLPACFDAAFAPDLPVLCERHRTTPAAVIETLCQTEFRVYMIGFMPGFPYMGGLPPSLHTPRLATPRTAVPARSLAVAGEMCAVYPWTSPGGWNLVGRTPIDLFDPAAEPPALLAAGDRVRWFTVDRDIYEKTDAELRRGHLSRTAFLLGETA